LIFECSSTLWLRRKLGDQYTRKAHEQHYVSRSAFKLLQIQSKYHIIKQNNVVVDLGLVRFSNPFCQAHEVGVTELRSQE
jgi:23S rRNA (uridine2552-2'-O)-methyltransferase